MTPEQKQALQEHIQVIVKILYEDTDTVGEILLNRRIYRLYIRLSLVLGRVIN